MTHMPTRRHCAVIALLSLSVAGIASAQLPKTAPPPGPVKPAAIPPFQEATLANGLRILLVESKRQPVVSLALMMNAGDAYDPAGKEGLAGLVANTLTKGAGSRTADQVSSAIENVGGSIGAVEGADFLTVRASVLSDNAPLAFDLVADAAARPAFAAKEIELSRTQSLSALQLEQSQPAALATKYFDQQLYGSHPYSRHPSPSTVRGISADDMRAFQKARLVPGGALLVVAGDITLARVRELAQKSFGTWSGTASAVAKRTAPPSRARTEILLVHRAGSVQSNIIVGNLTYAPVNPQFYATTVASRILGGGSDSRLFKTLREQRSWTYGAYSSLARNRDIGTFQATAEVRNAVTDSALVEMLKLERSMSETPVGNTELEAAKGALVGSLPLQLETAQGLAETVGRYTMLGLPQDFIRTLRPRLAAVNAAQVQAASKQYLRSNQALVVVVGDGAQIYERLAKIAPTRIINADGETMTAADLVAKTTTLPVDLSKLVERSDSFTVLVQGKPFGYQTTALRKTPAGYEYTMALQLPPFATQSATTAFGADLAPQSSKASGKMQGQDMSMTVAYANGRAKGSGTMPTPQGMKPMTVDTTYAPGVLDDNMLIALIPGLKWAPGVKYTASVFDASKSATRQITMAVAGVEAVTVPAGSFSVFRVDVTGGEQPVTLWITSTAPYRVVKTTTAGTPIEIVLAK